MKKTCPDCGLEAKSTVSISKYFGWRWSEATCAERGIENRPQSRCFSCRAAWKSKAVNPQAAAAARKRESRPVKPPKHKANRYRYAKP